MSVYDVCATLNHAKWMFSGRFIRWEHVVDRCKGAQVLNFKLLYRCQSQSERRCGMKWHNFIYIEEHSHRGVPCVGDDYRIGSGNHLRIPLLASAGVSQRKWSVIRARRASHRGINSKGIISWKSQTSCLRLRLIRRRPIYNPSLQDLGGSPALFGIMTVVNHGSEMFMNMHVFKFINKYGHVKVRLLDYFLCYRFRPGEWVEKDNEWKEKQILFFTCMISLLRIVNVDYSWIVCLSTILLADHDHVSWCECHSFPSYRHAR